MDKIREKRKSKYSSRFPSNQKKAKEQEQKRLQGKAKSLKVSVETVKYLEANPSTSFTEQF